MVSLIRLAEVVDAPGARDLTVSEGEVRFQNVSFSYAPDRPVLKNASFAIPPGHTVAVVGPSGAGKSTLARLLFRFYDVTGGAITIDGHDLRAVTQASLRRTIGVVPQDTRAVQRLDWLQYRIRAATNATRDQVIDAAKAARIHDFIEGLPDGYDTQVGERGLKPVQGGEKQRVAIARTILKNPKILILDEATSALDTATEREIQSETPASGTGTHRADDRTQSLSTVVDADEIIVLGDGRIVERGTHDGLLAQGGQIRGTLAHARRGEEVV